MRVRPIRITVLVPFVFCFLLFVSHFAEAQTSFGTLRGQVTDPSGAAVVDATILISTRGGRSITANTNRDGIYEVKELAPGKYTVKAMAPGFAAFEQEQVEIVAGQVQKLNMVLAIEVQKEKVLVSDSSTSVDINPSNNASTLTLKGKDLEALSDDPDELQSDLQALAGPSAGPNGGQIYIDGFTGGQLPPKASIREIRINQNPFSAEYDRLGYGRIEIFTKPGTDKFHGQFNVMGNSSAFNSRNPFVTQQPGYDSTQFSGNIGGPLSKKASFFFNLERRGINDTSVVNAVVLDPNFNSVPFNQAVSNPRTRTNLSPRLDYQFGTNNTLTVRYQYYRENETNNGIGQFNLASQGFNEFNTEHTLQISDTQIVSARTINETRFQYVRENNNQTAQNNQPTVSVLGAFTGGGSNGGNIFETQDRYELQNYTSMALNKHFLKFGGRLRGTREVNDATSSFNGTFTFGARTLPGCQSNAAPNPCEISALQAYQITELGLQSGLTPAQISALGGGASQFSIVTGSAHAQVTLFDVGLYVQDDWRVRSNVTVSYGLRFESQNQIGDHGDFAPRLGLAWGIGPVGKNSAPKTVLRAGFGMFYDRFGQGPVLQAQRLNGITQQQYIVTNPDFFLSNIPPVNLLAGSVTSPTTYRVDSMLRAPYTMQTGVSLERQLSKSANIAFTYLNSRGVHALLTRNINAPLPPTYNPSDPANRPFNTLENIYQYESNGLFRQNQFITNFNVRLGAKLSLFGYYTLNYANSDTAGTSSFPTNQYNIGADYGRASFDVRHRIFMGGTFSLPYGFRLSPFLVASSGLPFNITTGQDLNSDSIFNDRPAFATPQSNPQHVVATQYGAFDTLPAAGATIIPINYGTSPGRFTLNLRLGKTFGFGKKTEAPGSGAPGEPGGGGTFGRGPGGPRGGPGGRGMGGPQGGASDKRYGLTFGLSARNVFNNVNVAPPIGNLSSPLFGESNALAGGPFSSSAANRRIELQMSFTF